MMVNRREDYSGAERMTFTSRHVLSAIDVARNFVFTMGCVLCALFVSIYSSVHSDDAEEYRYIYEALVFDGAPVDSFSRSEILFYLWNKAVGFLGVSFEGYLFVSTLIFLPLKLIAFKRLSHGVGLIYIFFIYVSTYFFLHDSIQYKISWALALAAWACVCISREQFLRAVVLTALAAGFHITSVLLPLTFFSSRFIFDSRHAKLALIFVLMLFYSFDNFIIGAGMQVVGMYDPRYFYYLDSQILDQQNKSGLYYPYVFLMAIFVAYISMGISKIDSRELRAQVFVLCISVGILVLLRGYVALAARLSDVLGVLLVPVMAALFVRPDKNKWIRQAAIFGFCAVLLFCRLHYQWHFGVL